MTAPRHILVNAFPMTNVHTGIGRYLRCLYEALEDGYGDRLNIAYFDGRGVSSTMPSRLEDVSGWSRLVSLFWRLPAYPALMLRLLFHYRQMFHFRRIAGNFDLYHEAAFFPFPAPPHVKTVFTVHDLSLLRFPEHHTRERVLFSRLFFHRRCKPVRHFLTVSLFIQREMETCLGIGREKITVTPLGYDPKFLFPRSTREIQDCLLKHRLPKEYFLFVGSGDPRKNLRIIPEALDRAGVAAPLVAAGWEGWTRNASRKSVRFLGYVDDEDLACLYSGALALVFPSSYEGFGLPVLEAMACGCPVVATRMASMPEVGGEAALYIETPGDGERLAGILKDLSVNPLLRRRRAEMGLAQAGRFSWRKTAEKTFEAFERAIAE